MSPCAPAPCLRVVSLHRRSRVRPVRSHALECVEEARWGRKCGDAAWQSGKAQASGEERELSICKTRMRSESISMSGRARGGEWALVCMCRGQLYCSRRSDRKLSCTRGWRGLGLVWRVKGEWRERVYSFTRNEYSITAMEIRGANCVHACACGLTCLTG